MEKKEAYKARILEVMTRHIGKTRAIPMTQLHSEVFEGGYNDKINDTRRLRDLITELRKRGIPISRSKNKNAGGYFLPATESEFAEYCDGIKKEALGKLAMLAKTKEVALPTLLGQMAAEMEELNERGA